MILSLFVENYLVAVMAAIAFLIFIACDTVDTKSTMRNFGWATICILFLIAAELAEQFYAMQEKPGTMRVLASATAYSARAATAYFIAMVPAQRKTPRFARVLSIPLILNIIICYAALFTPLVFSYTGANHFTRGPLGYTPFIVSAFYLAVLMVFCFKQISHGEATDTIICACAVVMCGIGVYLEYEFDHMGTLPTVALFWEIFYFMYLLMTKYSTDYLTGAYVRSHMYKEVETRNCSRWYITFDVNGLKRINDKNGHAAGDRALTAFSEAVFLSIPSRALFYRLGGDEFAIIYRTSKKEEAEALIRTIGEKCRNLPYGISYGLAPFTGKSDFDEASAVADAMLYENKTAFWKDYVAKHPDDKRSLSRQ